MTNWNERARELLIKEEGKDIGNAGIAYLCYGIEESIQRVAKELEAAYLTGVRDENEAIAVYVDCKLKDHDCMWKNMSTKIRARREESTVQKSHPGCGLLICKCGKERKV